MLRVVSRFSAVDQEKEFMIMISVSRLIGVGCQIAADSYAVPAINRENSPYSR